MTWEGAFASGPGAAGLAFARTMGKLPWQEELGGAEVERLHQEVDVAVVGAGAAGLGAARTLGELGLSFVLLEASHRVGGRAYTEELAPGVWFDLGCHWMHSASLNPFVALADAAGFTYRKGTFDRGLRMGDRWATEEEAQARDAFMKRSNAALAQAHAEGRDISVAEATERDNPWTPLYDYMISLYTSVDSDQVSASDLVTYKDTDENWPLKEGYGNLVARLAEGLPVALNSAVTRIDWSGKRIGLETAKGRITARTAIVAVSTGILGGGDIRFDPDLPDWKQESVADLPLGCHNRIGLLFDRDVFGDDHPGSIALLSPDNEPFAIGVRPFGFNYVAGLTGGRFAEWLERAGPEAAVDLLKERLKQSYGSDITRHVVRHLVTAWRGDPWVKGSYSAAVPGGAHQRVVLAEPIDGRLFFAGEATSPNFFSTCHGAYLSGIEAAKAAAGALGREPREATEEEAAQ